MKTKLAILSIIISFAFSQCCNGCSSCTTPSCASCSSGFLIGNLLCVDGCPSTSTQTGSTCTAPSGTLFSVDFTTQQSLASNSIGEFSTQSSTAFISSSKVTPLPTLERGFYFEGSSSLKDNNSYIPSYLFMLTIWIRPISPGTILSVASGGIEYIKCETLSAGYKITSNFEIQPGGSLSSQSYQVSGLLAQWQAVSFQIQQYDYTTIDFGIVVDQFSNANSINGFEANYPSSNFYNWIIGNSSFGSSFQGFLSFISAWSNIVATALISGFFPNCINNQYWDGSACQSCLGTCGSSWPWCVRGTDCSYCASDDCSACTGYARSMCTSCVGVGVAPNCCDSTCATCSGLGYYSCSSCSSGSYLLRGICMPSCPDKYTQDSTQNKCIAISNLVVSLSLNDKIILGWITGAGFNVGSSNTNAYPIFESTDPIPAYLRGYYFTSNSYMASSINNIAPWFSLNFWLYPMGNGDFFCKYLSTSSARIVTISLAGGFSYVKLTLYDSSTVLFTGTTPLIGSWHYLSVTGSVVAGKTVLSLYVDNSLDTSKSSTNFSYLYDNSHMRIGNLYASGGFQGYLWSFDMYNDETQYSASWNLNVGCGSDLSPSSSCPTCQNLEYPGSSSCTSCLSFCDKGCRDNRSCNLCKTSTCFECTSFSGNCTSCITNAIPTSSGGCKCNHNLYWNITMQDCILCDVECWTCLDTTFFECSTCYSSGYLVDSICLRECPYGFGSSCATVTTPVINQKFNTGLTGTTNYGPFGINVDASRLTFFQSIDASDPVPASQRGIFLSELMYLATGAGIYISHSHSIGCWMNPMVDGDVIRYTASNSYFIFTSSGYFQYVLMDTNTTAYKNAAYLSMGSGWNYVSWTFQYLNGGTRVQLFLGGSIKSDQYNPENIFRPAKSANIQLGYSWTWMTGFLYSFQLWNVAVNDFSYYLNNDSCGSGQGIACLHAYTKATYNDTSTCGGLCSSNVNSGCARSVQCNQCYSTLCASCTGYGANYCTSCVDHASGWPGNCTCDQGYLIDNLYQCKGCSTGCTYCNSQAFNNCTACFPTYYLIEGVCNSYCPSGYSKNTVTNVCDIVNILPFSVDFQDLIVLNNISSLNIGSSSSNKYPSYDANDPWPAKSRGYYFSGTAAASTSFMFGPTFTITIWIKATLAGVVLEKYTTAAKLLLGIDSGGIATLTLALKKTSISAGSVTSIFNSWCYLSATNTFNTDGTNTLKLNINGVLKQTKKSGADWLNDLPTGTFFIGADPTYSNGFTGFIARIYIYIDDTYANSDYSTSGCGTGCTACPNTGKCLSDCDINKYPTTCTTCLNSTCKGCVRDLTCRLCKQTECLACESFSGDCTSCITNASLNSGSCSCDLNTFFDSPTQTCIVCDNLCDDCLSTNYFECSICGSSYIKINNICLRDCPYGFTSPNCGAVPDAVIDILFYETFQGSYGIFNTGAHSSTYQFWNSPEADDPIPALNRGLYFSSGSYVETNTNVYLFNSASMGIWVYTITSGDLIYKENRLTLKSNGSLKVTLEDPTSATTDYITSALTMTGWNYLSFSIKYSSLSTIISVYLNNVLKNTATYSTLLFRDVKSKTIIIGKSTTTLFKGFVYEFTLWNSAVTDFSGKVNDLCGTSKGSACLWTCNINQYYDSISGCTSCSSCTNGCRNSDNCNICYDIRCEICSDFEIGSCTKCFIGANLESGSCTCDEDYYWNVNSDACEICDSKCSSCTSSEEYGCNTCKAGYVLLNGICMTFCPLGYTIISDVCTLNSDYIFDLKFETLAGIIYDSKSFIPVLTGNSVDFYPNYDSYDPIAAYLRGVYFNGVSSVLQLPPFLNYKSPKLSLSPWFTISLWINPENSFGTVFYKSNSLSINTQLVSVTLTNYYPSILLRFQGIAISHKCDNLANHFSWSHVSFTIDFDTTGNTIITCFVNTISDSSPAFISDYFVDDPNSLSVKIGAYQQSIGYYTNFFKGFMYWMQIYNSVKSISNLALQTSQCTESCNSCPLTKSCIPNCKILEYWVGPSLSQCNSCNSGCSYSCKDSGSSCNLCYNNVCELCQDYTKSSCTQCKQNASNETSCSCDAPYLWNPYYEYCQIISEGQFWGDDGVAYSCPIKCKYCETETSCITCVDNAKLVNKNCTCLTGYNGTYNCNLMTFEAYLEVDIDNSLYLTFSEELKFTLNYGDFLVTIEGESNYKWIFEIQGANKYYISINIDFSIIANTPIFVNFTNSSGIFSINDAVLTTRSLVGYLYKYDYTSPYIESISQQAKTSSQIAVSAVMISSFVSMNPSSLWTMMNTIEILSFITLSSISITPALYAFLNSLNNYNIVPNFFADFIDQNEGIQPYKEAYNYGYETNLFLLNSGNQIETFFAIILCFPLVAFLSKCSQRWVGKRFTEHLRDYKYSVFVRFWLQNYIEIGATALIGLLDFSTNNGLLMFNVIICLILETLIVVTPFALLLFMIKNRKKIIHRSKAFTKTWDSLFYEFDIEKCHMSSQYYLLFIWRRIIYVLTLILLKDFPGLQGGIIIALSASFALYLAWYRPHEDPVLVVSNIYSEIGVLIVCAHITFFVFDLSSSFETSLEQSIYFWVGSIMVSNLIASMIIFFRTLYTILRPKIEKLLNIKKFSIKRIVPQTETEHSFEADNSSLDNPHLFE